LGRQRKLELFKQDFFIGLGLSVTAQNQLPAVGRCEIHIEHLNGDELRALAVGSSPVPKGVIWRAKHLHTVGDEGNKDVRSDALLEFRRFLHAIVLLPAQIVRSGRRIIYRIMGYNRYLKDFFAVWEKLRRMAPA
jgi:hypothetical protein